MTYSVAQLATVQECDAVLAIANKEKADVQFRQTSIQRQQANYAESSVEIATELSAVNAEIAAYASIIGSLPEGPAKEEAEVKKKKLEYRQFLLTERQDDYGSVALLEKEMELGQLEKQVAEIDVFIAAVQTRKAAL
ncbi:hypothetical protein [Phnomibacter ginsenosidimutans]|uniref:Uncharacterized protein n=1 Tax=Phnomibacter ginsenosidimutans TaxID=2676868 RepID=A0A6I6G7N5_9BACT|nr:hypothetical protein [Phnomibacter ginsenosidimutans]QGW28736.1 hypothetical protein GLV81_12070 [Phnomibacter ginsenosidimutans]